MKLTVDATPGKVRVIGTKNGQPGRPAILTPARARRLARLLTMGADRAEASEWSAIGNVGAD